MMNIIDRITKFKLTCDVGTRHFHYGHEYVEIGGIKWATMNIGANSVTDYGLYFQWGDTKGYTAEEVGRDKCFNWASYKYCNGTSSVMTKYNTQDGLVTLESCDDAVSCAWGNGWRMPTTAEFEALGNAVNAVWTNDYQGSGIKGFVFTDESDSSKVLFFPAAGQAGNDGVCNIGTYGWHWGSSLVSAHVFAAYELGFEKGYVDWSNCHSRCIGYPVRGVLGSSRSST